MPEDRRKFETFAASMAHIESTLGVGLSVMFASFATGTIWFVAWVFIYRERTSDKYRINSLLMMQIMWLIWSSDIHKHTALLMIIWNIYLFITVSYLIGYKDADTWKFAVKLILWNLLSFAAIVLIAAAYIKYVELL